MNTLIRSLGMAAGILGDPGAAGEEHRDHARLDDRIHQAGRPGLPRHHPVGDGSLDAVGPSALSGELSRQAAMVAYVDGFRLLLWMTL